MATSEDIARAIIRNNADEISQLSPEDRISAVEEIMAGVERSIPQVGEVDPETQKEITRLEGFVGKPGMGAIPSMLKPLKKRASQQKEGIITDDPLPAGDLEI